MFKSRPTPNACPNNDFHSHKSGLPHDTHERACLIMDIDLLVMKRRFSKTLLVSRKNVAVPC